MIEQLSWATIPRSHENCPSDLDRKILMHPCVAPWSPKARLNLMRLIFTYVINGPPLRTCLDDDRVDRGSPVWSILINTILSDPYRDATCRASKKYREHCLTQKKISETLRIKRGMPRSLCVTAPINLHGPIIPVGPSLASPITPHAT